LAVGNITTINDRIKNMSFNFFKNFAKVKADQVEEGLVNLAVALDSDAACETAIRQKMDEHDQRIVMLQEANSEYLREQREYEREVELYNRYINEAESIQQLLTAPVLDERYNREELERDLNEILNQIEKRVPIMEKEKREADQAKEWMAELQQAVDEIGKELTNLRETVNQAKRDIQQAEVEKERNRKKAEQVEILAGLKKSGNKFDTAINALKSQAEKEKAEAEKYQIKADSLKVAKGDKTSDIIGKYSTTTPPVANENMADRLARLRTKV
jgi:chromosome segregation ATPase